MELAWREVDVRCSCDVFDTREVASDLVAGDFDAGVSDADVMSMAALGHESISGRLPASEQ